MVLLPQPPLQRAFDAHLWWQRGDPQAAWDTINVPIEDPDTFYLKQLIFHAMETGDPEKVEYALNLWPEDKRGQGAYPEIYNIMKIRAYRALGRDAEAEIELKDLRQRLKRSGTPYPSGWSGNASYLPVTVPGLSGDLRGVNAAVREYHKIEKTDAWSERDVLYAIATAYALAGDAGKLVEKFGPGLYLRMTADHAFDAYRDHPKYTALKTQFETRP